MVIRSMVDPDLLRMCLAAECTTPSAHVSSVAGADTSAVKWGWRVHRVRGSYRSNPRGTLDKMSSLPYNDVISNPSTPDSTFEFRERTLRGGPSC